MKTEYLTIQNPADIVINSPNQTITSFPITDTNSLITEMKAKDNLKIPCFFPFHQLCIKICSNITTLLLVYQECSIMCIYKYICKCRNAYPSEIKYCLQVMFLCKSQFCSLSSVSNIQCA